MAHPPGGRLTSRRALARSLTYRHQLVLLEAVDALARLRAGALSPWPVNRPARFCRLFPAADPTASRDSPLAGASHWRNSWGTRRAGRAAEILAAIPRTCYAPASPSSPTSSSVATTRWALNYTSGESRRWAAASGRRWAHRTRSRRGFAAGRPRGRTGDCRQIQRRRLGRARYVRSAGPFVADRLSHAGARVVRRSRRARRLRPSTPTSNDSPLARPRHRPYSEVAGDELRSRRRNRRRSGRGQPTPPSNACRMFRCAEAELLGRRSERLAPILASWRFLARPGACWAGTRYANGVATLGTSWLFPVAYLGGWALADLGGSSRISPAPGLAAPGDWSGWRSWFPQWFGAGWLRRIDASEAWRASLGRAAADRGEGRRSSSTGVAVARVWTPTMRALAIEAWRYRPSTECSGVGFMPYVPARPAPAAGRGFGDSPIRRRRGMIAGARHGASTRESRGGPLFVSAFCSRRSSPPSAFSDPRHPALAVAVVTLGVWIGRFASKPRWTWMSTAVALHFGVALLLVPSDLRRAAPAAGYRLGSQGEPDHRRALAGTWRRWPQWSADAF